MNNLNMRQLQIHVPIVGWLMILQGFLFFVIGGFVFILLIGIGFAVDDPVALQVLSIVGTSTCGFMFLFGVPGLVVGIGMLFRKAWARVLGIVISILALFSFPFGTIIGIYSLFVLFQDAATEYFRSLKPAEVAVTPEAGETAS